MLLATRFRPSFNGVTCSFRCGVRGMTKPEMTIDEGLELIKRSFEQVCAQSTFENKVAQHARELWKLLVEKLGEAKAKKLMRRVMGNEKPGRPSTPLDDALKLILAGSIIKYAHESDEKIAKRILASKPCYVRYKSGRFGSGGRRRGGSCQ